MTTAEAIQAVLTAILLPAAAWLLHQNAAIRERLAVIEQSLRDLPCRPKRKTECPDDQEPS